MVEKMKNKILKLKFVGLIGIFFVMKLNATPNTPTIVSPYSGTGYTYNTRPWIIFSATDGSGHQINDVRIQVATDAGFGTVVYDITSSAGNQAQFYPLPASSGANIRHRIQTALNVNTTYYVRVMVWCNNTINRQSAWSSAISIRIISTPSFETITAGSTLIRAQHITELRQMIYNVRYFRKNTATSWTDSTLTAGSTQIRAVHMNEMRTALTDAFNITVGATYYMNSLPSYSDDPVSAGSTLIRKVHIDELRNYVVLP
jgi:hypothetical protein